MWHHGKLKGDTFLPPSNVWDLVWNRFLLTTYHWKLYLAGAFLYEYSSPRAYHCALVVWSTSPCNHYRM